MSFLASNLTLRLRHVELPVARPKNRNRSSSFEPRPSEESAGDCQGERANAQQRTEGRRRRFRHDKNKVSGYCFFFFFREIKFSKRVLFSSVQLTMAFFCSVLSSCIYHKCFYWLSNGNKKNLLFLSPVGCLATTIWTSLIIIILQLSNAPFRAS